MAGPDDCCKRHQEATAILRGIKAAAQKFCELHKAEIIEMIPGKKLNKKGEPMPMAYKCNIGDFVFHIYFNRGWYWKYDGITISKESMQLAINEHAVVVIFIGDNEYWKHSTIWFEWAEQDKSIYWNPLYKTWEVFIKRNNLARPAGHGNNYKVKDYFPNE